MLSGSGITVLGVTIGDYSGEALAAVFVILIFLGVWVPRRDRDQWRSAALKSADQVDKLLDSLKPIVEYVEAQQRWAQTEGMRERSNGREDSSRDGGPE